MIIPTPDFDPMFADDGVPFQTKMLQYIRCEFSDMLGPNVALLETPRGLDQLSRTVSDLSDQPSRQDTAA